MRTPEEIASEIITGPGPLSDAYREEIAAAVRDDREEAARLVESRSRHRPPCACDFCRQTVADAAAIRNGGAA